MKKLRVILLIITLGLFVIPLQAQFTKQQAIDLALNNILVDDLAYIDVFMVDEIQNNHLLLDDNTSVNMPYTNNWICFVNDHPFANWVHSCRYILINADNGNYQIVDKRFFPPNWKTNYTAIWEMPRPETIDLPESPIIVINRAEPNPNLYAIIVMGVGNQRFKNDASAIYCALIDAYGYTKENIFVHAVEDYDMDGDEEPNDFDYIASKDAIETTFLEFAGANTMEEIPTLTPNDQLFIFVTAHGDMDNNDDSYILLPGNDLYDSDLETYLENVDCAQIIGIFATCKAGGFYNKLQDCDNALCKNRSIHTSSNTESSWWEYWLTQGSYNEFVYYWTAAVRGAYTLDWEQPWNTNYEVGDLPLDDLIPDHPGDYDPDTNEDGFVQMSEAFDYANNLDTWSQYEYYNPNSNRKNKEDPSVPEYPLESTEISFEEDLLTLGGLKGIVDNSQTIDNRNYMIGGSFDIDDDLTLSSGGRFYFGIDAQINVLQGEKLSLEDNTKIIGDATNNLIIDGDFEVGSNVEFKDFYSLILNNNAADVSIDNCLFEDTKIENYSHSLSMDNTTFMSSLGIDSYNSSIYFTDCNFNNTPLTLTSHEIDKSAVITNCNFDATTTLDAINISYYGIFDLSNNTIQGFQKAIQMYNAGYGNGYNLIHNNEIKECTAEAISLYNTRSKISNNHIHDNGLGIKLQNKSNTIIIGNPNAAANNQTQQIRDNAGYELYTTNCSFPWYIRYNVIIDEDNQGGSNDALVYSELLSSGGSNNKEISYNCWGSNFNANDDLYPSGYYDYLPEWCPGGSGSPIGAAEELYALGRAQFEDQNYVNSKSSFEMVIEQFPNTPFAEASMKDLHMVENYLDSNFVTLQSYYQNNTQIQSDSILNALSNFMANKCAISIENWQLAIDHYENIIQNPLTAEDSIFAIIDLGYLYFLMDNSDSKAPKGIGKMLEHRPKTQKEFSKNRAFLLSLLPFKKKTENKFQLVSFEGALSQNAPNPFVRNTKIGVRLNKQSHASISIMDVNGKSVRLFPFEKGAGLHYIEVNMENVPSGVYYYSLFIEGSYIDTKKMLIVE